MGEPGPQGDQNVEYHLIQIFEKLESMRSEAARPSDGFKMPLQVEIRTIEFWRSVISECLSSFIYVFVVCGAAAGAPGAPFSSVPLPTALASGFAMTSLTQCFGHISGAHVNPAVSLAMGLIKRISILRAVMFVLAQCGGGIAGAAFLYGVTVPNYQGNMSAVLGHSFNISPWEKFGIEFMLTFIVVFSYFISMDTYRKWTGTSSLTIGATYSACSFVSMPYLNPARSLGPAFVLNKWENHWVYWLGPMSGGAAAALVYEYVFNPRRQRRVKESQDDESSSMRSDDIETFEDIDKPAPVKFHGSNYNTYRSTAGASNYCASLYSAPPTKLERGESIYGGTKSLYCNSPPLTRANLNRSQSVYAKSNAGIHKDSLPRPGPLVPAQSMYPLRANQHSHVNNQNVQNQLQQRTEGAYGARAAPAPRCDGYAAAERRENYRPADAGEAKGRANRPESVYGLLGGQRRGQSDDSSYGSYAGNASSRSGYAPATAGFHAAPKKAAAGAAAGHSGRSCGHAEGRSNAPAPPPPPQPLVGAGSYHHQHSPNPGY
ncbi:unnamed protein product [Phyllotreta striolata]|uniref:Neurogenic protein big brain n=1 Tax=Phyllotreta striolata TaxID=444603 RepID=A0A9N9XIC2_PHYSR|nr:unnamed protein product [Phyllotreta striolata]